MARRGPCCVPSLRVLVPDGHGLCRRRSTTVQTPHRCAVASNSKSTGTPNTSLACTAVPVGTVSPGTISRAGVGASDMTSALKQTAIAVAAHGIAKASSGARSGWVRPSNKAFSMRLADCDQMFELGAFHRVDAGDVKHANSAHRVEQRRPRNCRPRCCQGGSPRCNQTLCCSVSAVPMAVVPMLLGQIGADPGDQMGARVRIIWRRWYPPPRRRHWSNGKVAGINNGSAQVFSTARSEIRRWLASSVWRSWAAET